MPLPKPKGGQKAESKKDWLSRCYADPAVRSEFKEDNNQIGGYCYTAWEEHKKKESQSSIIVSAANDEYVLAKADNTDPINDSGDNTPVSNNPAPPAIPFPKDVAPKDASPHPYDPRDNATDDDLNPEYVGGRKVDPKPLPNPESGGLDPNPDNPTSIPTNDTPNSFQDDSAKPKLDDMSWYLGGLDIERDEEGMAKWPLKFRKIEKDFKRPNKPENPSQEPKSQDQQNAPEVAEKEKPFDLDSGGEPCGGRS